MNSRKTVLITDLDNTLFDWVDLWHSCFKAMLTRIVEISGIDETILKPEIRLIHQHYGTSEYSFLIEKIPSIREKFREQNLIELFDPAIAAYRMRRREKLRLYPAVAETILKIKGAGAAIVGYTESMAFYSNNRVRRLGLDGVFDRIFSPEDHDIPAHINRDDVRKYPAAQYKFRYTRHVHTPRGSLKPGPEVLLDITRKLNVQAADCVYVGDSLHKDVAMAQDANIMDIYAQYGRAQHTAAYQLLREVTHWSNEDVEREKRITKREVSPGCILQDSFAQILENVEFGAWDG